jgi:hypothetical protein
MAPDSSLHFDKNRSCFRNGRLPTQDAGRSGLLFVLLHEPNGRSHNGLGCRATGHQRFVMLVCTPSIFFINCMCNQQDINAETQPPVAIPGRARHGPLKRAALRMLS